MMKANYNLLIPIVLLYFLANTAYGQQKPVLSQYMYSGLVLNPAYAGVHEYTTFTAMYRDQWINVPGAPTLTTFTAQTGIKDRNIGTGLMISEDKIGVHSNLAMYGSYAYNIRLQNGAKFSMGLQGGLDILRSNWSELVLDDINDPTFSGSEINYFPNFGSGVFYSGDRVYMGLSVPYILTSRKTTNEDYFRDVRHSRNYYITAGYVFDLGFKFKMKPSFLLRLEDNMPLAFDLNTNFIFDDMIDIGFSYRSGDAFIGMLGLQANNYLKFSYAYDYILSSLTTYTKGSHELMLQYRINFNAPKRHRMCPQPMYF